MTKKANAFTIVELLIVIVVIAILAAISIVAYTGIQQRANNTAIINAVSQSIKAIHAYVADKDTYPYSLASGERVICITTASSCQGSSGNAIASDSGFVTRMNTIGTLPLSVPNTSTTKNGVIYQYNSVYTFKGESQPLRIVYWLNGIGQNCGVSNVLGSDVLAANASTTGYTVANQDASGKTRCVVSVAGPVHS